MIVEMPIIFVRYIAMSEVPRSRPYALALNDGHR